MRVTQSQVSRLATDHYQVRATRGYSVVDVRINGGYEEAQRAARYLADGLDALLDGMAAAIRTNGGE
ncbi:MAG: hypothetical protein GY788_07335 [bacterium]|nr:hypothetical protein [bacterium]